jgi:hypothetical protein
MQTKDIGTVAAKWSQRAQAAGADYTAGVKSSTKDWAGLTCAATLAWEQGVAAAVGNGRFAKGVTKAGTQKWQSGASTKGAARYPQGVQAGSANYANNFGPMLQVIAGVNLTPRGPRGSPSNIQRVSAIADALHQAKLRG